MGLPTSSIVCRSLRFIKRISLSGSLSLLTTVATLWELGFWGTEDDMVGECLRGGSEVGWWCLEEDREKAMRMQEPSNSYARECELMQSACWQGKRNRKCRDELEATEQSSRVKVVKAEAARLCGAKKLGGCLPCEAEVGKTDGL